MARKNTELVYSQGPLFLRRTPADTDKWEVLTGARVKEGDKVVGFAEGEVIKGGFTKGKDARDHAKALNAAIAQQTQQAA